MKVRELLRSKKFIATMVATTLAVGFFIYDGCVGEANASGISFFNGSFTKDYYNVNHEISILSQNLRAPKAEDGEANTLARRSTRLLNELTKHDTDIKCFQECTKDWKTRLDIQLNGLDYKVVYDYNNKGLCNPIYIKNVKFKLLDSGTMTLTVDSSDTYNESRVASWAKVMDRKTGKTLVVMNTHIATERMRQIDSCTKMMDKVEALGADGYIVCGDFNYDMNSNSYAYGIMKRNNGKDMAIAAGSEGIQKFTGGTFHNYGKVESPKRIDFFFGSANLTSNLYSIVKDTYNGGYVSDHYGILNYITIN